MRILKVVRVALNMGICIVWLPTDNFLNHMPISNYSVYYRWSWIKPLVLVCINWRCVWYECELSHRFISWKHNVTSQSKTSKSHRLLDIWSIQFGVVVCLYSQIPTTWQWLLWRLKSLYVSCYIASYIYSLKFPDKLVKLLFNSIEDCIIIQLQKQLSVIGRKSTGKSLC